MGGKGAEGRGVPIARRSLQSQSKWSINFIGPQVCGRKLNNWQHTHTHRQWVRGRREGDSNNERASCRDCENTRTRERKLSRACELQGKLGSSSCSTSFWAKCVQVVCQAHTHTHTLADTIMVCLLLNKIVFKQAAAAQVDQSWDFTWPIQLASLA